jgi:hypothetical protein
LSVKTLEEQRQTEEGDFLPTKVTGNSDLPAVRVPGQLKIDGMLCRPIREIRFMHNDDLAFARRDFLERLIQVIRVQINVVYPNDPEPLTVSFQWHGFIAQNSETTAIEGIGDEIGAVQMVVVAENETPREVLAGVPVKVPVNC